MDRFLFLTDLHLVLSLLPVWFHYLRRHCEEPNVEAEEDKRCSREEVNDMRTFTNYISGLTQPHHHAVNMKEKMSRPHGEGGCTSRCSPSPHDDAGVEKEKIQHHEYED